MEAPWYFDFVSPFAYLQLQRLGTLRARLALTPMPVVLGALFNQAGLRGPAEIPAKRTFTYRFVQWQAERAGVPLRFPPAHPFNPLAALRLCIAAGGGWPAVEAIYAHLWRDGGGAALADLAPVAARLGIDDIAAAVAAPEVKMRLRANTEEAIAAGVFGVPTVRLGGALFWGNDATAMIEDYLDDPQRFSSGDYARLELLPVGSERRPA